MYRVTTINGDILGHRKTRREANELAEQQARQLQEVIVIKKKDSEGCYQEVERRIAQPA